jgi:phosphate transport system protein
VDELRRAYHDRIADLRGQTIALLRDASRSVGDVTAALVERDRDAGDVVVSGTVDSTSRVAEVEAGVLDIIAQQAPVGRDLRVVLAALRIAQISDLCLGLSRTLGARVGRGHDVLTPNLRALASAIGEGTSSLLEDANGAWIVLDEDQARTVVAAAGEARDLQRRFLAELLGLDGVPVDAAVDLGMAARVYERLTDHAVEIAGRVLFAVTGVTESG